VLERRWKALRSKIDLYSYCPAVIAASAP